MKITTVLILASIWCLRIKIANANYRRVIRGPPQPPRPPPGGMQHAMKKWHIQQGHRPMQQRPIRPIPVHMPQNFKSPMGPPKQQIRHQIPMRQQWKKPIQIFSTEKPFLSSPSISFPEYEYHIQTNNIPTHPNTIQQIDEKGPIHTIPAPNLSLLDRPKNIEDGRPHAQAYTSPQFAFEQLQQQSQHSQQQVKHHNEKTIVSIQKAHQYQVTETPEHSHTPAQLPYFAPDPSPKPERSVTIQDQGNNQQPHAEFLVAPQEPNADANTQELYKFLTIYPQAQMIDGYPVPQQQHQFHQEPQVIMGSPNFRSGAHFFDQNFPKQLPVQPKFHSFDYSEQDRRNLHNQIESRVTNVISVKPTFDENEALAQSQFVQHFFDTRNENEAANVGGDERVTIQTEREAEKVKNNEKNVNSNNSVPISIYVPDGEAFDDSIENDSSREQTSDNKIVQQYDHDVNQEETPERFQSTFGKRKRIRN